MTQASNLANFANNLNTSGQVDPNALSSAVPVSKGGTGASTFTANGILKGNGTSAISVATAANIVSAIGTTAVTNATNATKSTRMVTTNWIIEEFEDVLQFKNSAGELKMSMSLTDGFTVY
jgi:hypothetical protein